MKTNIAIFVLALMASTYAANFTADYVYLGYGSFSTEWNGSSMIDPIPPEETSGGGGGGFATPPKNTTNLTSSGSELPLKFDEAVLSLLKEKIENIDNVIFAEIHVGHVFIIYLILMIIITAIYIKRILKKFGVVETNLPILAFLYQVLAFIVIVFIGSVIQWKIIP